MNNYTIECLEESGVSESIVQKEFVLKRKDRALGGCLTYLVDYSTGGITVTEILLNRTENAVPLIASLLEYVETVEFKPVGCSTCIEVLVDLANPELLFALLRCGFDVEFHETNIVFKLTIGAGASNFNHNGVIRSTYSSRISALRVQWLSQYKAYSKAVADLGKVSQKLAEYLDVGITAPEKTAISMSSTPLSSELMTNVTEAYTALQTAQVEWARMANYGAVFGRRCDESMNDIEGEGE